MGSEHATDNSAQDWGAQTIVPPDTPAERMLVFGVVRISWIHAAVWGQRKGASLENDPPLVIFAHCVFSRGSVPVAQCAAIPLQHVETKMTKPTSVASSVIIAALLSVAAIPAVAQPQHINCAYAAGCVEKMICDSPQLFNLDARMTRLYFHLQSLSSRHGAYELLSSQVAWLSERDTCGCNANCLVSMYESRINSFVEVLGE